MNSLYVILDFINNGYVYFVLIGLTFVSVVSAIAIILLKNPIVSVLALIVLFITISAYLICLDITFLGLAYILVYVGAISILFLFILMLINIRVSELVSETKNSLPLVFIVSIVFLSAGNVLFYHQSDSLSNVSLIKSSLSCVSFRSWEDALTAFNNIVSIGNILYTVYAIFILMVSLILLLAMVGAIAITVRQLSSIVISKNRRVNTSNIKIWKVISMSFFINIK